MNLHTPTIRLVSWDNGLKMIQLNWNLWDIPIKHKEVSFFFQPTLSKHLKWFFYRTHNKHV